MFKKVSGLKLNNKKTEALWIGTYVGRAETLCPEKDLKWVKSKVKVLGVWLATDPTETINANYGEHAELLGKAPTELTRKNYCFKKFSRFATRLHSVTFINKPTGNKSHQ